MNNRSFIIDRNSSFRYHPNIIMGIQDTLTITTTLRMTHSFERAIMHNNGWMARVLSEWFAISEPTFSSYTELSEPEKIIIRNFNTSRRALGKWVLEKFSLFGPCLERDIFCDFFKYCLNSNVNNRMETIKVDADYTFYRYTTTFCISLNNVPRADSLIRIDIENCLHQMFPHNTIS